MYLTTFEFEPKLTHHLVKRREKKEKRKEKKRKVKKKEKEKREPTNKKKKRKNKPSQDQDSHFQQLEVHESYLVKRQWRHE